MRCMSPEDLGGETASLVFGLGGHGKSTFTQIMLGANYEYEYNPETDSGKLVAASSFRGDVEPLPTDSVKSQNGGLHLHVPGHIDPPGPEDTRGEKDDNHTIIPLSVLDKLQSVFILIDYKSFAPSHSSKATGLRRVIDEMLEFFGSPDVETPTGDFYKTMFFVFTKVAPANTEARAEIIDVLQQLEKEFSTKTKQRGGRSVGRDKENSQNPEVVEHMRQDPLRQKVVERMLTAIRDDERFLFSLPSGAPSCQEQRSTIRQKILKLPGMNKKQLQAANRNLVSSFVVEDLRVPRCPTAATAAAAVGQQHGTRWHMSAMTSAEMQNHLTKRISWENFAAMRDLGVLRIRLPVGYWNFVEDANPNMPREEANLMTKVGKLMTPAAYRLHLDRAFRLAAEFGMQILLDLHVLPGSQNGEMHSGWREELGNAAKADLSHFCTPWNWGLAFRVLEKMVDFVLDWAEASQMDLSSVLYGIQVINEPNATKFAPRWEGSYRSDADLMRYYEQAIRTLRGRGLPLPIPVVLFAWTSELQTYLARMELEPLLRFSDPSNYNTFGKVVWDTHITNAAFDAGGGTNLLKLNTQQRMQRFPNSVVPQDWRDPSSEWRSRLRNDIINPIYKEDIKKIRPFTSVFGNEVIVGEWSLAGLGAGLDGGKIFAFGEELSAMFRAEVIDHFYKGLPEYRAYDIPARQAERTERDAAKARAAKARAAKERQARGEKKTCGVARWAQLTRELSEKKRQEKLPALKREHTAAMKRAAQLPRWAHLTGKLSSTKRREKLPALQRDHTLAAAAAKGAQLAAKQFRERQWVAAAWAQFVAAKEAARLAAQRAVELNLSSDQYAMMQEMEEMTEDEFRSWLSSNENTLKLSDPRARILSLWGILRKEKRDAKELIRLTNARGGAEFNKTFIKWENRTKAIALAVVEEAEGAAAGI